MKLILLLVLLALSFACRRAPTPQQDAVADGGSEEKLLEPPATEPKEASPPKDGPFVEPPLWEKPTHLYWVAAGCAPEPRLAEKELADLSTLDFLPPGYPALDQAPRPASRCPFLILAGKFARRPFAEQLARAIRQKRSGEVLLLEEPYRHDRFMPSAGHDQSRPGAGRVLAGFPGEKIQLHAGPQSSSPVVGQVADGAWLSVLESVDAEDGRWHRVSEGSRQGHVAPGRLLFGHHVFSAPDGRRAVLSVPLGCAEDSCRSDWWLVERDFSRRRLLAPAEEKFFHAFSPDGRRLAWAAAAQQMQLELFEENRRLELGAGVSPSWTASADRLYFRRPAGKGQRDEILFADAPEWQVKVFYDFPGRPFYPKKLSAHPPQVDVFSADSRLYTMFLRLLERDGGMTLVRWKTAFDNSGRLLAKKAEQLTE